jgi:putative membrane protein
MMLHLPDYILGDLIATFVFGLVAILLIIIGYKVFDKLTPRLNFDELLKNGNIAMAIVIGSFIIGLCYVVAHVVSAILGG